jgi:cytochrome P450
MNTTSECFEQLVEWVRQYPDIFAVTPDKRKDMSLFVNHPDFIKHILVSNHDHYQKGVGFERVKMLLGNGIIVSDGPFWRKQRRMIQPAFGKDVIARLVKQVKQANLQLFEKWHELAKQQAIINITDVTNELALEIILRALFSEDLDTIFKEAGGNPFSILTDDSARDLKLAVKFRGLTKLVGEVINKRRQHPEPRTDFVSVFMDARDKETGEPMSDKELVDEVMTLIVAGSETSATTLNWVWYCLSQYPEVEAKLHAEVDNAAYEQVPSFENIMELSYTRQVTEEVLRLYPPVWLFTRKAIEQDKLGEYDIPPGTDIFISPYFLHRHPDFWDEPEKFNPERFDAEAIKQRHKFAFIPFSAGPRRCIGDFFGIVETQIHFGLMARHFRMEHINDYPVELAPEVNLRTKHPINMRIQARS